MALFSRRPKKPAETPPPAPEPADAEAAGQPDATPAEAATVAETPAGTEAPEPQPEPAGEAEAPEPAGEAQADDAASVPISVSSFGGLGVGPSTARPAGEATTPTPAAATSTPQQRPRVGVREWMRTAPEQTETIPGLRDNALLHAALGRVGDAPPAQALLDVARQLLQGHVFLRVKGDARALLAEGKGLPLAVATVGERTFALVYSSGAALQASLRADGDGDTSAMAQPVLTVLQHVVSSSHDGIILDPASSPSRAVLPKELLQRALEQADPKLTLKTLLAAERTLAVTTEVAEALTRVPLWVAVGTAESGARGLAESRSTDGTRHLEVYSHPLEVAVMGRGDSAAPITPLQLSRALRTDEGITGVLVDPAGPWLRLTRDELAPVLALS